MTALCDIEFRLASIEEILDLRAEVIIAGTDRDSPDFDGDRDDTTRHFGAFDGDRNIGCLSFMLNEWKGEPAWQLRGMATHPDFSRQGIGRRLLAFSDAYLTRESGIRLFWCNARKSAVGFYQKQGWVLESEEFAIPGVGPHFRMSKVLQ
jgi:GNAT superfamily N-acetyltransferase